ncbi:hypothetical protein [Micromonospora lutea]|uniref:Lipoprotein n=1 Tax=Micromonospora lutea TaxID=419825 RepID=A0ABQ4IZV8_9ACTN|nr:hypothetical protein [Micromonospora lutea]GIJ23452.1 hypothetical protein Vlu01_40760 [Micromonospora lutea]
MKVSRALLVACLVVPLLTACVTVRTETPMAPPVTYTCCETADIDRLYTPGQMFTLHWMVEVSGEQSTAPPRPVDLEAELTGPFSSVEELKAALESSTGPAGRAVFKAETVRASGEPGYRPVSTIAIPTDAEAGFYNLTTTIVDDDHSTSGMSIVEVVPGR